MSARFCCAASAACGLPLRDIQEQAEQAMKRFRQEVSLRQLLLSRRLPHFLCARRFSNKRLAEVTSGAIASLWRPGAANTENLTLAGWRDSAATQDPDSASTHCRQHEGIKKRTSFMRMIVFRLPVFLG
jgi:hypothetical protein